MGKIIRKHQKANNMDIYTIIATPDEGGVFVSQLQAVSPLDAFLRWSEKVLDEHLLPDLNAQQFQEEVAFEVDTSGPVAVEGTAQVWCFSLMSMWVHLIKTDTAPDVAS